MATFEFAPDTACSQCGATGGPEQVGLRCMRPLDALRVCAGVMRGVRPEPQVVDWPDTMRDSLGEASQMNDELYANLNTLDATHMHIMQAHDILARLINATTWLVDENTKLRTHVDAQSRLLQNIHHTNLNRNNP